MTDYLHELSFGAFITPDAGDPFRAVEVSRLAETVGLDYVTIQDHPYQARFLDTWTLLTVIAGQTSSLRLAPNVASLPLRPPVVFAKSAASLDLLSNGRIELGLGTGAFWDAIEAAGGPRRSPREAVAALAEAIELIRLVWQDGTTVRFRGDHYHAWGLHGGPAPAHPIGIWVGAYKPRMLALTGRTADGWLPSMGYADPPALGPMNAAIDEAALAAGRTPADVRRLYNINGTFGRGSGFLAGSPADWAEQLAELSITQGMSAYFLGGDDSELLQRFGQEVAPAVRELVERERSHPSALGDAAGDRPIEASGGASRPAPATEVAFGVQATPDDGVRRSSERLWDETARPTGPAPEADRSYRPDQLATGQHLVDVHNALRAELSQLMDIVQQVADGAVEASQARSAINEMTMRQNNWTLGAFCESYCRIVTGHHSLEDRSVFPHLRRSDDRLSPVLDRLEEEHEVIADVLDRVDRALVALVTEPDGMSALRAAVDLLSDTLLSHLAYEERELVEPLSRLGFY